MESEITIKLRCTISICIYIQNNDNTLNSLINFQGSGLKTERSLLQHILQYPFFHQTCHLSYYNLVGILNQVINLFIHKILLKHFFVYKSLNNIQECCIENLYGNKRKMKKNWCFFSYNILNGYSHIIHSSNGFLIAQGEAGPVAFHIYILSILKS